MFSKFRRKGDFLDKKETKRGPNLAYYGKKNPKGKKSPKGGLVFHPVSYQKREFKETSVLPPPSLVTSYVSYN